MVAGSMTRMRSQSMSGRSKKAWRRGTLKAKFEIAPPTMVMLDSATAVLVGKPGQAPPLPLGPLLP